MEKMQIYMETPENKTKFISVEIRSRLNPFRLFYGPLYYVVL